MDRQIVNSSARLPGLDALRGLAALGVLFWHYGAHFGAKPLEPWLHPFYTAGLYLVDVFFVLSGYLLACLYRRPDQARAFLAKRAARLFPLHWVTLGVVVILQAIYLRQTGSFFIYTFNDLYHFILNLGLLQYVGLQKGFSFNGPAWSISVEWVVNLVFLGLLLLPRWRVALGAVLCLSGLAGLWLMEQRLITGAAPLWGWFDGALLRGLFGFFAGLLLAKGLPPSSRRHTAWDVIGLVALALLLVFMSRPAWQAVRGFDFMMVGVVVPALIAGCSRGRRLADLTQWRALTWLGDVSFSVYLWHFPIQLLFVIAVAIGVNLDFAAPGVLAIFIFTSYLAGHLSWTRLEMPAQRKLLKNLPRT